MELNIISATKEEMEKLEDQQFGNTLFKDSDLKGIDTSLGVIFEQVIWKEPIAINTILPNDQPFTARLVTGIHNTICIYKTPDFWVITSDGEGLLEHWKKEGLSEEECNNLLAIYNREVSSISKWLDEAQHG